MILAIFASAAVSFAGFQLKESTPRADWYVFEGPPKLTVDVKRCERFLRETEQKFGVVVPRFTYRRVEFPEQVQVFSGVHAGGVANPSERTIISTEACSKHEIVHLVTAQISRPDKMFREGIAAMLGRDYHWTERRRARAKARKRLERYLTAEHSFRRYVSTTGGLKYEYVLADGWVRHLVKRHGMPKLVLFFRTYNARTCPDAFRLVYGADLDAAFANWLYGKKRPPPPKKARQQ